MEDQDYRDEENNSSRAAMWVAICSFLALAIAVIYYNFQQRAIIDQLAAHQGDLNSIISQLQGQLASTTARLNEVSAAQAAAAKEAATAAKNGSRNAAAAARAQASRLQQLQASLDIQKKQLQATQHDVTKTRSDLEDSLSSTRDELNGSIAKTHDELVLLEKRGERNYFEFDATKGKNFQRTGPVSVSLRRTDPKHANLDLVVLVNDRQITKSRINLYEPVWIYERQDSQPLQVVINKIDKNRVHGYISASKYNPAELATSASSAQ
jgi:hypothetical protein